ncbi:MAG: tetratricopeptide repeat protein [Polyangiales bacterium]
MSIEGPKVFDLAAARPEGWYEEVIKQSKDFKAASELIGRATLGLALVAGVRIVSVSRDPRGDDMNKIEFAMGPGAAVREVTLAEFRQVVGATLLAPLQTQPLPPDPGIEALQAYIGGRYMLEASLFEVQPLELRLESGLAEIALQFNELRHVLALEDFRDVIDERVRSELGMQRPSGEFSIDLAVADRAREASEAGDFARTITLLNPWLTPISMLLRTGEAEELAEDVHLQLSSSLDLLGSAYAELGDFEAANEVLRLGIQWAGDSEKAAGLYLALGGASVSSAKYGEAIGLLRRAIRLGADEARALPLLAEALEARDQTLAAMVCVNRALEVGSEGVELEEAAARLRARLGEPWVCFSSHIELQSDT